MLDCRLAKDLGTLALHQALIDWFTRGVWVLAIVAAGAVAAPIIPPPPSVASSSYLLIDANSQKVLSEENALSAFLPLV